MTKRHAPGPAACDHRSMRVRAVFVLLALTVLLAACGGSAPEASKTATAQPSAATEPASTAPAATAAKAPLAGPTTAPSKEPSRSAPHGTHHGCRDLSYGLLYGHHGALDQSAR